MASLSGVTFRSRHGERLSLQPCFVPRRATSQDLVASLQVGAEFHSRLF